MLDRGRPSLHPSWAKLRIRASRSRRCQITSDGPAHRLSAAATPSWVGSRPLERERESRLSRPAGLRLALDLASCRRFATQPRGRRKRSPAREFLVPSNPSPATITAVQTVGRDRQMHLTLPLDCTWGHPRNLARQGGQAACLPWPVRRRAWGPGGARLAKLEGRRPILDPMKSGC